MQTFLPFRNFAKSASVLDRARLGKQRVETMQIMKALHEGTSRWGNHPATLMWQGYECVLMMYQVDICLEWDKRGYKDTCLDKTWDIHNPHCNNDEDWPPWLGLRQFHRAHRSNLLRKNFAWYHQFPEFRGVPTDLEYYWPSKEPTWQPKTTRQ
ncbi:MAG: MSMEG_6728 family protein [Actinobacteria bacterium]|nr:MSMEG_6728 family protein [Actinomycetota bacterium]MCA1807237.1 MSMEG_6728 family protein [Actinomycetota bacterium]